MRHLNDDGAWLNYRGWFLPPGGLKAARSFVNVNDVVQDGQGQLWLGSENGLVHLYGPAFQEFSPEPYPYIWAVVEDREGALWFSSYGKGLFRYTKGQWPPKSVDFGGQMGPEFLAASAMDGQGHLYFGNIGGLLKYDGEDFRKISGQAIFSLAYDAERRQVVAGASKAILLVREDGSQEAIAYQEGLHDSYYVQAIGIDEKGNYWLGSYTGLIRNFLDASHQGNKAAALGPENEISLEKEIELIRSYVEFEQLNSNGHFDFELEVAPDIQPKLVRLPPMLLQPFVENAIKHGLLPARRKGLLSIKIAYLSNELFIAIEDDGVGLGHRAGPAFRTHRPLGSRILKERIHLLNQLGYRISTTTEARQPHGTHVAIIIKEEDI